MALLSRLPPPVLTFCVLLASCDGGGVGRVAVDVYDMPVVCDPDRDVCVSPDGDAASPLPSGGRAFLGDQASRYAPAGVFLYFELQRPKGVVALVELDFPTGAGVGGPPGGPFLTYREYSGEQLVFRSARAAGRIEAAALDSGCDCQDGRFELVFTDPGPDGALDTSDDRVRRLSRGHYSRGEGAFCRAARLLAVPGRPGEIQVVGLFDCPSSPSSSPSSGGGYYEGDAAGGCYVEDDDGYYDDGGCGYDEGDTYDDGYDSGGCEGDSSGDDYYGDGSGCEGDSSGYSSDGGGCEGDASSDSASCEGDAYAAVNARDRRRRGRADRALGMLLPFLALGLVHGFTRTRAARGTKKK